MTPAEFDAACRELLRRCPELSETSGRRSAERNAQAGGHPDSKHRLGMARDLVGPGLHDAQQHARELGLWFLLHDAGTGVHLHVQGLPPGDLPTWWVAKFGGPHD
tara:strand:+ start:225 stop:539 length:315 start_codon:yes stop_codon:yes gene_type:complete